MLFWPARSKRCRKSGRKPSGRIRLACGFLLSLSGWYLADHTRELGMAALGGEGGRGARTIGAQGEFSQGCKPHREEIEKKTTRTSRSRLRSIAIPARRTTTGRVETHRGGRSQKTRTHLLRRHRPSPGRIRDPPVYKHRLEACLLASYQLTME